ncbi:hypothetical protein [Mycolicibacterium komossense]|uniref:Transposase n=1 Tax=Mycolicibacterium komossense TaxID=1779 RepID=A0ABT3CFP1_9MYCO|nr:hypothetical protein [Mycolicibacterium komossense]MCV7228315.1 hypothetical protein [Mycolicibacterium komossense]
MVDDVGAAQARLLLNALYEQVAKISHQLESAELRGPRTSVRGAGCDRREQSALRRDLYEAHRLIDGLHRKFPDTDPRLRRANPVAGRHLVGIGQSPQPCN